eukprot:TRINITY_DN7057_c1_g1_i6.p2 TRINITY_DN7057_c1_g1~~TRINITY_DN7057_c1_g1_i6.p2  ORF type:complete len:103 (-),score=13.81 TRINITY_DN7057_c1_g1_i6:194-502(-)
MLFRHFLIHYFSPPDDWRDQCPQITVVQSPFPAIFFCGLHFSMAGSLLIADQQRKTTYELIIPEDKRPLLTFECRDTTIITISKIAVQVMKNMLREHDALGA